MIDRCIHRVHGACYELGSVDVHSRCFVVAVVYWEWYETHQNRMPCLVDRFTMTLWYERCQIASLTCSYEQLAFCLELGESGLIVTQTLWNL